MRLYLVRHPKPLVAENVCYGRTDLTVLAEEHARALSSLRSTLPERQPIFCSPSQRCVVLADGLADVLHSQPAIHDARLMEMNFGNWEMHVWNDIPRTEIDAWADDLVQYRPGGGENVLQLAQRVRVFHDDLMQSRRECAIVVCHAGTIRLLLACQYDLTPAETALYATRLPHAIAYGGLMVLDC
ncbi:MAG: histidine phosphatase family protein [Nitrosomonadaceae bacterium]|nr:histidine phosphatase family protein [Nitrosomonadaceae bacterium]